MRIRGIGRSGASLAARSFAGSSPESTDVRDGTEGVGFSLGRRNVPVEDVAGRRRFVSSMAFRKTAAGSIISRCFEGVTTRVLAVTERAVQPGWQLDL